ncbi:MAG: hypothetical protein ACK5OB_13380 [Pirellula sp.]
MHGKYHGLMVLCWLGLTLVIGCGKPPMQEVLGSVRLDGKPVSNCKVGFFPDVEVFNPDRHGYGFGLTNDAGEFTIQHPQGEVGIWAGKYKVTFVAWVSPTGKIIEPDAKPSEVEGGVTNMFPIIYESPGTTPESVVVKSSGVNSFSFDIQSKP